MKWRLCAEGLQIEVYLLDYVYWKYEFLGVICWVEVMRRFDFSLWTYSVVENGEINFSQFYKKEDHKSKFPKKKNLKWNYEVVRLEWDGLVSQFEFFFFWNLNLEGFATTPTI